VAAPITQSQKNVMPTETELRFDVSPLANGIEIGSAQYIIGVGGNPYSVLQATDFPFMTTVLAQNMDFRLEKGICINKVIMLLGAGVICTWGIMTPQSWPSSVMVQLLCMTVEVSLFFPKRLPGGQNMVVGISNAQAANVSGVAETGGRLGGTTGGAGAK